MTTVKEGQLWCRFRSSKERQLALILRIDPTDDDVRLDLDLQMIWWSQGIEPEGRVCEYGTGLLLAQGWPGWKLLSDCPEDPEWRR